jgi:hypothetical protein
VPSNVTILGPAGGGAVLAGDRTGPGIVIDSGGLQDLDLQDFTVAISTNGTVTVKNIRILTNMIGVQAESGTHLTIDKIDITGAVNACATGIVLNGGASLAASTLATRKLGVTLLASDNSVGTLTGATVTGDPACAVAMIRVSSSGAFALRDSLLDGGRTGTGGRSGVSIGSPDGNPPGQVSLENITVRNVDVDALGVGNATVSMTGGELSHVRQTGLEIVGGHCALLGVSISNSGAAFYAQDGTLAMRGCTIFGNAFGGDLGLNTIGDLGTQTNPGNNVFNNAGIGLLLEGSNGAQPVQAVGNTWKTVQIRMPAPMENMFPGRWCLVPSAIG